MKAKAATAKRKRAVLKALRTKPEVEPLRSAATPPEITRAAYVPASRAKNQFAAVLEDAQHGREVFITKHNAPKAVLISVQQFEAMRAAAMPNLDALKDDFDRRIATMQTAPARAAMQTAFEASSDELARGAVPAATHSRS